MGGHLLFGADGYGGNPWPSPLGLPCHLAQSAVQLNVVLPGVWGLAVAGLHIGDVVGRHV